MTHTLTDAQSPLLVITGPTASGKSGLAIEMAKQYNGEIISADSRQIYRGMDIGTGKVVRDIQAPSNIALSPKMQTLNLTPYFSEGIAHYLIDICEPNDAYNVTDFVRDAKMCIHDIRSRGKIPILCGGTGFWIQALLTGQVFPPVPPNTQLRKELANKTTNELFEQLKGLDERRSKTIDTHNRVRLIRAIEISLAIGKVPEISSSVDFEVMNKNIVLYALTPPQTILHEKIHTRLHERLRTGMIEEVKRLHHNGISYEKLESFGLEYKWIAWYLQQSITEQEMHEKLYFDIIHYAKRQITWLKRFERQGAHIHYLL